jgi:hypothetical protein
MEKSPRDKHTAEVVSRELGSQFAFALARGRDDLFFI